MNKIKIIEGGFTAQDIRCAIIASRFNRFIVDHLLEGALDVLHRHGVDDEHLVVVYVPGAFEMPLVAKRIAAAGQYDAIIAVGTVIRGNTPHFEYVAGSCVRGLAEVSMQSGVPVALGVLTVDSIEQAIERAGCKAGNKGAEAAQTAIEMVDLLRGLEK